MNERLLKKISSSSTLIIDEPMSRHTSWNVGGKAGIFFKPSSISDLKFFLSSLDDNESIYWIGLGSNLLVRDGGYKGVVICTLNLPREFMEIEENIIKVSSGMPCAIFSKKCTKLKLGPTSFFAGIPGTLGGALAMNAGAFGEETWMNIDSVETINRKGEINKRTPKEYKVSYRSVEGIQEEWFLSATFALYKDENINTGDTRKLLSKRAKAQPIGKRSCGSVFRNPIDDYAARLIDEAGLKGQRVGDAAVSEKHANFIINLGSARASDIENLIYKIKNKVKDKFSIDLELEVKIIGENSFSNSLIKKGLI